MSAFSTDALVLSPWNTFHRRPIVAVSVLFTDRSGSVSVLKLLVVRL